MPRHKIPSPPRERQRSFSKDALARKEPTEHVQAREAVVERIALQGLVAGMPYKSLVAQIRAPQKLNERGENVGGAGATKEEAEDALRRAEEEIRLDMAQNSLRDMALSYRRIKNAGQKVYLLLQQTSDPRIAARLAHTLKEIEERLAKMRGWDEPERMHVTVSKPSDQTRKVYEGLDDDALVALAVEETQRRDRDRLAREILGLPLEPYVVEEEGHG